MIERKEEEPAVQAREHIPCKQESHKHLQFGNWIEFDDWHYHVRFYIDSNFRAVAIPL